MLTAQCDNVFDLTTPSRARILRVDIDLVGCPGELTELTTVENGARKPIFSKDDARFVRQLLGRTDVESGTFAREYRRYLELKKRLIPVLGFGHFIRIEDVARFHDEVAAFNEELRDLRMHVRGILEKRLAGRGMHEKILRFNPRVKLWTYILSRAFVNDRRFVRSVEIVCRKLKLEDSPRYFLGNS